MIREQNGNHKSGESPAAAQIDPDFGRGRPRQQLRTVREMPVPHVIERRRRDQIDSALPQPKQFRVEFELFHSFTWNRERGGEVGRSADMGEGAGHLNRAHWMGNTEGPRPRPMHAPRTAQSVVPDGRRSSRDPLASPRVRAVLASQ